MLIRYFPQELHAANSFQIFATQTLFGSGNKSVNLLANFWTKVVVETLSAEELAIVLKGQFPELSNFVNQFIDTFNALRLRGSDGKEPDRTLSMLAPGRYLSTRYRPAPLLERKDPVC